MATNTSETRHRPGPNARPDRSRRSVVYPAFTRAGPDEPLPGIAREHRPPVGDELVGAGTGRARDRPGHCADDTTQPVCPVCSGQRVRPGTGLHHDRRPQDGYLEPVAGQEPLTCG